MSNVEYSIVAPFFNEEKSVKPLYDLTKKVMDPSEGSYELIFVNDGSTDGTARILEQIAGEDSNVIVVNLGVRRGQTAASKATRHKAPTMPTARVPSPQRWAAQRPEGLAEEPRPLRQREKGMPQERLA